MTRHRNLSNGVKKLRDSDSQIRPQREEISMVVDEIRNLFYRGRMDTLSHDRIGDGKGERTSKSGVGTQTTTN